MHSCTNPSSHTLLCNVKYKACAAGAYNTHVCTGSQSIVLKQFSTLWPSVRKSGQKADLLQLTLSESLHTTCLPNCRGTARDSVLSSACRMCSNRTSCYLSCENPGILSSRFAAPSEMIDTLQHAAADLSRALN